MAKWYFDSAVLVAGAVSHHVHNSRAIATLEALVQGRHHGYMSTHGLTEVYSALTRTPFRPPVSPIEALKAIEDKVIAQMTLISLDER